jgi:hypothetical protein
MEGMCHSSYYLGITNTEHKIWANLKRIKLEFHYTILKILLVVLRLGAAEI